MLFNSYLFIFGFLPVALAGFYAFGRFSRLTAIHWLIGISLAFYAWWRPLNLLLIAPSILINFVAARLILHNVHARPAFARAVLLAGIVFNVCFLGYFKYLNFFESSINDLFGANLILTSLVLPLGISFITFQKIAFLIDVHAGRITEFTLRDYGLFVLFFPQLIAGPIVHYREMMPQFQQASYKLDFEALAVGISLFSFGLFKKVVLADSIAFYASPIYGVAANGIPTSLFDAWIAALGFTLQIYFDFSGYSDMALGLARLFGVRLPVNFNSPLRATSIIDFWLRWHITLTRFLTAYIYNPLALSLTRRRLAQGLPALNARQASLSAFVSLLVFPTLLTMFVSGLWHGAGYTFLLWGLLHGAYISVNHGWRQVRPRLWSNAASYRRIAAPIGFVLTFLCVVVGMVLFRAPTVQAAVTIWQGMLGWHGATAPQPVLQHLGRIGQSLAWAGVTPDLSSGLRFVHAWLWTAILLAVALALPNSLEMHAGYDPALGIKPATGARSRLSATLTWRPSMTWALAVAAVSAGGILSLGQLSEFLYWQF